MRTLYLSILFFILLLFSGNVFAAEVIQGKCIDYQAGKTILVEEYDTNFSTNKYGNPTEKEIEFDITNAEIGIAPQNGDIIRLAYVFQGDKKTALKIMNVTRQDLMKK